MGSLFLQLCFKIRMKSISWIHFEKLTETEFFANERRENSILEVTQKFYIFYNKLIELSQHSQRCSIWIKEVEGISGSTCIINKKMCIRCILRHSTHKRNYMFSCSFKRYFLVQYFISTLYNKYIRHELKDGDRYIQS